MAANARSMAASVSGNAASSTAISTNVPRSGRARRMLPDLVSIERQDFLDPFGDVMRRQGGAGNIADVPVHLERTPARLSNELGEPTGVSDLAAIGLAVLKDIDAAHLAAQVQGHGIVDIEVLADHTVEHEEADYAIAVLRLPDPTALLFDKARRRWEGELLRLGDSEILDRAGRGRD